MKNGKSILVLIGVVLLVVVIKQIIKKSVRENVISSTLKGNQIPNSDTVSKAVIDTAVFSQIWFTNTQHGLAFETPKALQL